MINLQHFLPDNESPPKYESKGSCICGNCICTPCRYQSQTTQIQISRDYKEQTTDNSLNDITSPENEPNIETKIPDEEPNVVTTISDEDETNVEFNDKTHVESTLLDTDTNVDDNEQIKDHTETSVKNKNCSCKNCKSKNCTCQAEQELGKLKSCNCSTCYCKSCKDAQITSKNENCTCKNCKNENCSCQTELVINKPCDCVKCYCNPCKDPNINKSLPKIPIEPLQQPTDISTKPIDNEPNIETTIHNEEPHVESTLLDTDTNVDDNEQIEGHTETSVKNKKCSCKNCRNKNCRAKLKKN